MRVGFDASLHGPRTTGAGEYQRQLLRELPAAAVDMSLVAYTGQDAGHTPTAGCEVHQMPWAANERSRRIIGGAMAWRRRWRVDRLDLFHVPFYYLPPGAPSASVVTVYDTRFLRYPETYPVARAAFMRLAVPWSLRRASHIITISEFTKRELVELLRLAPERISVTLLAPRDAFRPVLDPEELNRVRDKYALPPRFILSTSTLEPRKNLDRLIDAFAMVRQEGDTHELVLSGARYFGTGPIESAIARHKLGGLVHFPGYVDDADMPALYSLASVFAYPSLYEGFGIPPLEAMACGTVTVVSNVTSMPEVVGDAAVLVDPRDVGAIAGGLRSALDEVVRGGTLQARGIMRAREFTWARTARETVAVYRHVLKGSL